MGYSALMITFGWLFIIAMLAAVLIPWLRGKSDLFTVWNLFLLGSANFVGLDSVATGSGRYASWGTFTTEHYVKFIVGALAFYVPLFLTYYLVKFPRRLAGVSFRKWPRWEGPPLTILLIGCLLFCIWGVSLMQIQGLAQLGVQMGPPAGVLAVTLVLTNWLRRPFNAAIAASFFGVFLFALLLSVYGGAGRRSLMSLVLAIPICLYWLWLRYKPVRVTAWPLLICSIVLYMTISGYSAIRHHINEGQHLNPVAQAIDTVEALPSALTDIANPLDLLPSGTVSASLVCIDTFPKQLPTYPFQTIIYILANPIPRAWWPGGVKPVALGEWFGYSYGVWARMGHVNISMGIVGHGYYDGGPFVLVIYGILYALFMRFADELLVRQCDNPFLIGALAAASGNIYGLSRGEVSIFTLLILAAYFCSWAIARIGRFFSGVGVVYPTDQQRQQLAAEQQLAAAGGYGYGYEYGVDPRLIDAYAGTHPSL